MKPRYQALRGARDILPAEIDRWQFLERTCRTIFERYGFREIRTPLLESTDLFARSVGESTDIVRKEMYTFQRGDESFSLRPENTAPVVRAFVEHSLYRGISAGFPDKLYYIGPMFRYERPQKGRQRQFHQIGVEVLGAPEPTADVEVLDMLWSFLDELGVGDRELALNSVGHGECRAAYRARLVQWVEPRVGELCEDCQRRFRDNPLRMLDCKVEADRRMLADAPTMLEALCEECTEHFARVRSGLDRFGIPYRVNPSMVRGLDYYERTVFEVTASGLGAQNAILGGGRYDGLVETLGGPQVPGLGFAIGMERLLSLVPDDRGHKGATDVLVVALGAEGWVGAVDLTRRLRRAGIRAVVPLRERPMGAQLKRAGRLGARYALFVGADELHNGLYGLKDLATGTQVDLDEAGVIRRVMQHDGRD
jgi:histidyl-tRNA synthetase